MSAYEEWAVIRSVDTIHLHGGVDCHEDIFTGIGSVTL